MDPLHQFVIKPIFSINVCGVDFSFTNSSFAVFVTFMLIYFVFSTGIRRKMLVPNRAQAIVEMFYMMIANMIGDNVGKKGYKYFPFVFTVFLFVLFGNLSGMIPYMFTFTSHIIATFVIAMIVFLFVTILGFYLHGWSFFNVFVPRGLPGYLKPLVVPIELISFLSRPVSLAVRLFANMMAGHTVVKVFAGFASMLGMLCVAPIAVNVILTGFEIAVAALQAYIFTILTCVYLNDAIHLH